MLNNLFHLGHKSILLFDINSNECINKINYAAQRCDKNLSSL